MDLSPPRSSSESRRRLFPLAQDRGSRWNAGMDARPPAQRSANGHHNRSEEHTSELQSLMRISYAVFCLKKKNTNNNTKIHIREPIHLKNQHTTVLKLTISTRIIIAHVIQL